MSRTQVPKEARLYRKRLFAGDRLPTDDEKWRVYDDIVNIYGCTGYTRRQHSNWCTDHERSWFRSPRAFIAARLQATPDPGTVTIVRWALELKITVLDAFRLVAALLPEEIKAQAYFEHSLLYPA